MGHKTSVLRSMFPLQNTNIHLSDFKLTYVKTAADRNNIRYCLKNSFSISLWIRPDHRKLHMLVFDLFSRNSFTEFPLKIYILNLY
jgi:hypothetical protein